MEHRVLLFHLLSGARSSFAVFAEAIQAWDPLRRLQEWLAEGRLALGTSAV